MVKPGMVFEDPSERTEVLATPQETGDRYRIRVTAPPGGGPGIRGSGLHTHPGLVEIFQCVSGTMTARLGRDVSQLDPGKILEVRPGIVHGFKNTGDEPAVVDVDMVFTPPGPRPEADLMAIGVAIAGLARDGKVNRRTGFPPILQFAVIADAHPEAMKFTGLAGMLMPSLAALGRLRGYRSTFPEYDE
jgi:quercetin dioxygenase-like cupin family protein